MAADPRCGSTAGYKAHQAAHTAPCQPCRDAMAAHARHYRARMYLAGGPMTVDATGTRRRLRALARMGWSTDDLAARLDVTGQAVRQWMTNRRVRRDTAARVARLYDELWDWQGPSPVAAKRAATAGWPPPLAWDDEDLDDPHARPSTGAKLARTGGAVFDEVAVAHAMHGDPVHLRPVERAEVVRRLTAQGLTAKEIAERLDVAPRSVQRHRAHDRVA